jgi:triacylglycerol lipase
MTQTPQTRTGIPSPYGSVTASAAIGKLSFLQRALLFAKLSKIAYSTPSQAKKQALELGFGDVLFFDRDGAQAYRFQNDANCVIAFRGTEPKQWNDIAADAKVRAVLSELAGKVHRGFKREADDLWPLIETSILRNSKQLYLCGHSLGAAMATICALRCVESHIPSHPAELFTFGSPRIGNKRYIASVPINHFRFVNNNDIVAQVPPIWLGYRHSGCEIYANRQGELIRLDDTARRRDRWHGFLRGLKRGKLDHFSDHSIDHYIEIIDHALQQQAGENDAPKLLPIGSEVA